MRSPLAVWKEYRLARSLVREAESLTTVKSLPVVIIAEVECKSAAILDDSRVVLDQILDDVRYSRLEDSAMSVQARMDELRARYGSRSDLAENQIIYDLARMATGRTGGVGV